MRHSTNSTTRVDQAGVEQARAEQGSVEQARVEQTGAEPTGTNRSNPSPTPNLLTSVTAGPTSSHEGLRSAIDLPRQSLASHLSSGRFFACEDVSFTTMATSLETATAGQLVVYRTGQHCPMQFTADALALGVAGILAEQILPCPLPQCVVGDIELALAEITSSQLERPDRKLLTIGVTGSAGKTTTALMIASLLRSANVRTAYQTDLGECDGIVQSTSESLLPTAASLVVWLGEAVDSECNAAVIELDQAALTYGHYESVEFDLLIVTGPAESSDHFGPTSLQCALERLAPDGVVVTPADDPRVERVVREAGVRMVTYGTQHAADVTAKIIDQSEGMSTLLVTSDDTTVAMETPLCGGAMAACHCAAITVGLLIEQPLAWTVETLGQVRQLPGRLQSIANFGHPTVYLDIAGTSKRLAATLRTARSICEGKLWCVLSLTGAETQEELAEYGRLAEQFSGQVVLTCHPSAKSEFLQLAHHVLDGVKKCAALRWVADWTQSIHWTVQHAKPNDTVLVVGGIRRGSAQQQRRELAKVQEWIEQAIEARSVDVTPEKPQLKIFG